MEEKNKVNPIQNIMKNFSNSMSGINAIINDMNVSLYGSDTNDESDKLNDKFNSIMSRQISQINGNGLNDYTTFLGKMWANDKESASTLKMLNEKLSLDTRMNGVNPGQFISDQYKNRMVKQADANQISNQLIELKEAKSTMRDAILSADVNTGRINRKIVFERSTVNDVETDYTPIIEEMEKHFDTPKKIKDFIVDNCLGYGEYYVYTIPYHELFNEFASRYKRKDGGPGMRAKFFEAADDSVEDIRMEYICESTDDDAIHSFVEDVNSVFNYDEKTPEYKKLVNEMTELVSSDRFSVSTEHIPIPILENGLDCMKEFSNDYITEDGNFDSTRKKDGESLKTDEDAFIRKYGTKDYPNEDGTFTSNEDKEQFDEIKDCYVKMIEPTKIIPVEIMGQVLFYIYIQTEDTATLDTIFSYQTQMKERDPANHIDNLVQDIANRIVAKFDKKFVSENKEFRSLIVSALQYYDMGNTKIHFQVIPKEYITAFKINCDENGHGHSMLEPSLFYAKLYLMLLMFKIVTIVTKSNDQEINYIRTSGIDKNVFNKAQEIARRKQARRITVNDMFSYTGMINKIASGSAIYMPLSKNGDKPIETEILQGQDVQINNDLMDTLRNSYILGSGVPSAIMNYLNEADFAKSIENANTKMNGRIINYQIDLNGSLTEWYQKLLRFSTSMPEEIIQSVRVILPEPKGTSNITTQELINNYTTLQDFLVKLYFGESPDDDDHVREFIKEIAKLHLPMINFKQIEELFNKTLMESTEKKINKSNDDEQMDI